MTLNGITESQRRAAKAVGFVYLFALVPAVFAEFYVLDKLVNLDSAAETARNIITHERLFRLGVLSNLTVFAADIVLITGLYVVLKPINRNLALLAAFWGLIETSVLVVATLSDFEVLRLLSGADYLRAFEPDRLQSLARLSIGAHSAAYNVGLVFAGLRSTVFCYLWLKSRYIPRALAALGLVGSALLAACAYAFIIFPEARSVITITYYGGPIFLFELTMGLWLLLRPLRAPATAEPVAAAAA